MLASHLLVKKQLYTHLKTHTINLKTCPETLKTPLPPFNSPPNPQAFVRYNLQSSTTPKWRYAWQKYLQKYLEIGFHFLFEKCAVCKKKRATPSTPALWPTFHQTKEPICWKTEISTKWVIWCQLCFSKRGTALQIFTTQLVWQIL